MEKVLILYFSGVGNTKYVAEIMGASLRNSCQITSFSIEDIPADFDFYSYTKLIIGTPTMHSEPAKPMEDFLKALHKLKNPLPAFLFATCGLYPENVLRIFSKLCLAKNIIPVMHSAYRCRATDGVLLMPGVKFFWNNEKKLEKRIARDIKSFLANTGAKASLPRYKFYGVLNFPNKWVGRYYHFKIYVHQIKCTRCGKCRLNCPVWAIKKGEDGYPQIERPKCINCYRCIHHCPHKALSLSPKRTPKKTYLDLHP